MKKVYSFMCILLFSGAIQISAQTTVPGGNVYGTWTLAGSPYNVMGSIQIPNDSTLTIQAGVQVVFQGLYQLKVAGRLIAIGTAVDSITFKPSVPATGFMGIRFASTTSNNDTSKISYASVRYGNAGSQTFGGGFYIKGFSKVQIMHSSILYCKAATAAEGGGIYVESASPVIKNNNIIGCTASSGDGGGIFFWQSSARVENNLIANNSSAWGAGMEIYFSNNITFRNNVIANNTAVQGGGGFVFYGTASNGTSFVNNTIVYNTATNGGGAYFDNGSTPVFRNCIFNGNVASTAGSQMFLNDEPSDPNIYYSDIDPLGIDANGNFYTGTYSNNISSNPLFVSPSGGAGAGFNGYVADWSLQAASPCVDKGDPTMITQSTDKAGNPRVNVCRIDQGAFEYQSGTPFAVTINETTPILCGGQATGVLQAVATGSGAPYTYTWTPGSASSATLTGVAAGYYTVTAANSTGCVRTATVFVNEPQQMQVAGVTGSNIACRGACTGAAAVTVTGGTGALTYTWSSTPAQFSATTTATLCAGTYSVHIRDANGCVLDTTTVVSQADLLAFNVSPANISCHGANDGAITVAVTSNNPQDSYSLDGGSFTDGSSTYTFFNVTPGTHTVTVSDNAFGNGGCQTGTATVSISEPPALTVGTSQKNLRCYGGSGSATVTVSGGVPGYSYAWNPNVSSSALASNLSPGVYSVTVTDNNGCAQGVSINISQMLPPAAICMLTVDSTSTNNIIYWEKGPFAGLNVDSFVVYREVSTNIYKWIGAVSKDSLSMFVDNNRSVTPANGDPNVGYYHYKLKVRDSCGTYSAFSPYHTSIFFVDNHNGTFTWNLYDVEGQTTPVANFNLMRDSANINDWHQIGSVAGTTGILNDPTYFSYQNIANWRVEAAGLSCTPTLRYANQQNQTTIVKSKSNISNNRTMGTKVLKDNGIALYPNPFSDKFIVTSDEKAAVTVYNALGDMVYSGMITDNKASIDLGGHAAGVYNVTIKTEKGVTIKKIVKQ